MSDIATSQRSGCMPQLVTHASAAAEKERPYRICVRCVMDTSDPEIVFDEAGVCNHCLVYQSRAKNELCTDEAGQARLARLVDEMQANGRGKDYDCVIGLSGGVDSSYVAYVVTKKLGLRPLAVHLDNGWNSELAVANIENIVKTLKIDLYTKVLDWNEFKNLQLSFLKASVPNCEIPTDHAITSTLFRVAREQGIRHIISGSNFVTEAIMPPTWGYDARDWRHIKAIHREFGSMRLKQFPRLTAVDFIMSILVRRIRFIPILNFFPYNKQQVIAIIESELGWKNYGRKHGESRFTRYFQEYYLPVKFGYDKRRAHLSTLVNAGQISREKAIESLRESMFSEQELREQTEFFKKKFGIMDTEFTQIMAAPPRRHAEFVTNAWLFSRTSWFHKVGRRIATGRQVANT